MASSRYKYNIEIGHYVPIFEADTTEQPAETANLEQQNQDLSAQGSLQAQTQHATATNLESPEVIQMRQECENTLKRLLDEVEKKQNNWLQCQQKLTDVANAGTTDLTTLNSLQKTVIQACKEISDAQFNLAKKKNEYDNKIFQLQAKLVEGMQAALNSLPEKYKNLNESNVQNAKVYISKIFDNDYQERIKGLVDFKKAFANSNLLYGKDKEGYFAVCLDLEDLNKLTNTLVEIGYNKDDIYSVVLSQMFDRSDLVKA